MRDWRTTWAAAVAMVLASAACAPEPGPPPVPMQGAELGDPSMGLAYAQATCAACHGVAAGEASAAPGAPPFEELANTPGMTSIALTAWLNSSHENMPNLIVDPERIDDLSAYILTLEHGE